MFIRHIDLGTIAGIPVQLHLSWLLFLPLGAGVLALEPLAAAHSDWSPPTRWLTAVIISVLMLISTALHEAAHLATAVARRLPIHRMILYPFGGVTRMGSAPVPAAAMMQMTLAGPLASLLQSGFWTGVWWLWDVAIFLWLVSFNLLLALINLLPTPPLDGGRLLKLLRHYLPVSRETTAAVAFLAAAGLSLSITFSGGMAIVSGLILSQPAYILGGILLLLAGWLLQNTPDPGALICTPAQRRWLRQTSVAQILSHAAAPVTANGRWSHIPTASPTPGFFFADTSSPTRPRSQLTVPTLQPWTVQPTHSLLHALHKLDTARASRLLVVTESRITDTLTRDQILDQLPCGKDAQQMTTKTKGEHLWN